jgi:hypothetical protein
VVFDRDGTGAGMSSRLETLLKKFGLEYRYDYNITSDNVYTISYANSDEILEQERNKVIEFLKKSNLKN